MICFALRSPPTDMRAPAAALRAIMLATIATLSIVALPVEAQPSRGRTSDGIAFATGGISISEQQDLERHRDRFSLWVTTAARKSGADLADVQVRITDSAGKVLFNAPLPGPWLFIDLPPGRYTVEATHRGKPQTRATQIRAGDGHPMVFHFDDAAPVSPKGDRPFKASPTGGR
jgi:hypothetical protein